MNYSLRNLKSFYLLTGLAVAFCAAYFWAIIDISGLYSADGWSGGDWLINYSAGFIRRGLSGQLIDSLASYTGISHIKVIIAIKLISYICIVGFVLHLVCSRRASFIEFILFLAPWALMFDLINPTASGRKEILLFATFCIYVFLDRLPEKLDKAIFLRWQFWFQSSVFIFLILSHEGLYFFLPFFGFYDLLKHGFSKRIIVSFCTAFGLASIAFISVCYFRGTLEQANIICSNLTTAGLNQAICQGGINQIGGMFFPLTATYLRIYGSSALLTFIPLFSFGFLLAKSLPSRKAWFWGLLACLGFTFPLYVVAYDWGRWIHIAALMTLLVWVSIKPLLVSNRVSRLTFFTSVGTAIFLYLYVLHWRLIHCCLEEQTNFLMHNNLGHWIKVFWEH